MPDLQPVTIALLAVDGDGQEVARDLVVADLVSDARGVELHHFCAHHPDLIISVTEPGQRGLLRAAALAIQHRTVKRCREAAEEEK